MNHFPTRLAESCGLAGTAMLMFPTAMANSNDWSQTVGLVDEKARDKAQLAKWLEEISETIV